MSKKLMNTIIRVMVSLALIAILLALTDRQALLNMLVKTDLAWYSVGLLVYFVAMMIWSVRWHLIIKAAGESVRIGRIFSTTLIGIFYSMFLPAIVGADVGRMYELSNNGKPTTKVVSTVLLDRLIGLVSLVLMALAALVVGFQYANEQVVIVTVVGLLCALLVGWMIFFNRNLMRRLRWVFRLPGIHRLQTPIKNLYESLHILQSQPRLVLSTIAISFLMQTAEVMSVIFIARALGIQVSIIHFFVFLPITWVITTIPVSINGLGVREGVFAFFFSQVGVASADAVAMSLLYYAYRVVVGVVGGFIMVRFSVGDYLQRTVSSSQ